MSICRFAGLLLLLGHVLLPSSSSANDKQGTQRLLDRAQVQSDRSAGGSLMRQVEKHPRAAPAAQRPPRAAAPESSGGNGGNPASSQKDTGFRHGGAPSAGGPVGGPAN